MKKIFVFYDISDLNLAKKIAQEIRSSGFEPWLADEDSKFNWTSEIEKIAETGDCIGAVVLWSNASKTNLIIKDEATTVVRQGKTLLNLLLVNNIEAPMGLKDFPRLQFDIQRESNSINNLKKRLSKVFDSTDGNERALNLKKKVLLAPSMIFSISSFETQIEPDASLELLQVVQPPAVLVSAYDLIRPEVARTESGRIISKPKISNFAAIKKLHSNGATIFLDSGNYEAMRYKDKEWKNKENRLSEIRDLIPFDLAFTHDRLPQQTTINKASVQKRVNAVVKEYERDRKLLACEIAPIIHAPVLSGNRYYTRILPEICAGVVNAINPQMIAIAERELGDGLMERVKTVATIRKMLNEQGATTLLHVLGTGNPITMAFLSMAGADFFDGLEWCRTTIDGSNWHLHHFQQWDLFSSHSIIDDGAVSRLVKDTTGEVPWITKVALHNITFFKRASQMIQTHHNNKEYEQLFLYTLDLPNMYQSAISVIKENS